MKNVLILCVLFLIVAFYFEFERRTYLIGEELIELRLKVNWVTDSQEVNDIILFRLKSMMPLHAEQELNKELFDAFIESEKLKQ